MTDYQNRYRHCYVQITYTAGFPADPSDGSSYLLSAVPDWLQKAAQAERDPGAGGQPVARRSLDQGRQAADRHAVHRARQPQDPLFPERPSAHLRGRDADRLRHGVRVSRAAVQRRRSRPEGVLPRPGEGLAGGRAGAVQGNAGVPRTGRAGNCQTATATRGLAGRRRPPSRCAAARSPAPSRAASGCPARRFRRSRARSALPASPTPASRRPAARSPPSPASSSASRCPAALDSTGQPLQSSPRDWPNTFVAQSKAGNLLIFQRRGTSIVPLYVLKTSVYHPAAPEHGRDPAGRHPVFRRKVDGRHGPRRHEGDLRCSPM